MIEDKRAGWKALIALAPAMAFLLLFMFFPLFNTLIMSFLERFRFKSGGGLFAWNQSFQSIGFGEYLNVLRNPQFLTALKNAFILVIVSVPISVSLSLLVAVALNKIKRLQGLFQTIFFLPYVTNTIALGMVFKVMFSTNNGLINTILKAIGMAPVAWLTDATAAGYWSALAVITIYTVWNGMAFKILVFLSGLQSIDKQYYQAAQLDNASRARVFWRITVPLLSPMIAYVIITSFIGAFKSYTDVIAVFGAGDQVYGPPGSPFMWITVVGFIYKSLKGGLMLPGSLARASAGSVILLIIILFFTVIQLWVSKKKVHY